MKPTPPADDAIAIVGMAVRFPGASDLTRFWENLRSGVESIRTFEPESLAWSPLLESAGKGAKLVGARAMIEEPEGFDAGFFNVTPREAELLDPQHRVFLETVWSALENAAYDFEPDGKLVGVFAGSGQNTYLLTHLLARPEEIARRGGLQVMLTNDKDFLPTRISYKLNLRGPSVNIQSACSTSLVAICAAAQSLLDFQCDLAVAGGVTVGFPQNQGWIYGEGEIFSPDGHCRAFDAAAAGTVPGDGAGAVVLKRLPEALAEGNHIWAVIRGWGVNNDGSRKVGFTAPSVEGQAEAIAMAHASAGVAPESISYVEAHGTATPMGDPIEFAGLVRAFGSLPPGVRCALGSVKTNLGHLDTAAGVAGLIKTALALHHRELPPSLHFREANPALEISKTHFYVNDRLRRWTSENGPRRAGVSSFGMGGTNAHVVLEEAPPAPPPEPDDRPQIIPLSAKTETALERMAGSLAAEWERIAEDALPDAAFTLQTGRKALPFRRAVVCRRTEELSPALRGDGGPRLWRSRGAVKDSTVVYLFPGQGAIRPGAGRVLYRSDPVFRAEIDRGLEAFQPFVDFDLRRALGYDAAEGEVGLSLGETRIAQPVLFLLEHALARLWISRGVTPEAMAGHSLGEYAAATIAGVFSLSDAARIIALRARLMQDCAKGAMLAVRLPEESLARELDPAFDLAAVNAPNQCVVSGPVEKIEEFSARLGSRSVACRRLATFHGFHSRMMEPVLAPLAEALRRTTLNPPRIPYLSNLTGKWITPGEATDPAYWTAHLRNTVRFADNLAELSRRSDRVLLELGPGQTLGTLARSRFGESSVVPSLGGDSEGETDEPVAIAEAQARLWVAGVPIEWGRLHQGVRRRRLPLPGYAFERQVYRLGGKIEEKAAGRNRLDGRLGIPSLEVPAVVLAGEGGDSDRAHGNGAGNGAGGGGTNGNGSNGRHLPEEPAGVLPRLKNLFWEMSGVDMTGAPGSANFLDLGFDSLFLTNVRRAVQDRFGAALSFRQLMGELSTLERLAAYLDQGPAKGGPAGPVHGGNGNGGGQPAVEFPLTEGQREVWLATQLGSSLSTAYNQPCLLRLRGPLDLAALNAAARELAARHEALRITFDSSGEKQRVRPKLEAEFAVIDLSDTPEAAAMERVGREISEPFDLLRGPLARFRLFRRGPEDHFLLLLLHHIVCDGSALGLLAAELAELYTAAAAGRPADLPPPDKFSEFARRESAAKEADYAAAESYWVGLFADSVPVLHLPTDRPRRPNRTYAGARRSRAFPPEIMAQVQRLAADRRCSPFTVLFSVFALLLHRQSGQDDLVIGVPAAAQVFDGRQRLVGHCVNLLPLRCRLAPNLQFGEYLDLSRQGLWTAFEHWRYPFGELLRKLDFPRDPGRVPLANVVFDFERARGVLAFGEIKAERLVAPKPQTNFDLLFEIAETDDGLQLNCTYSSELFDPETIDRLIGSYGTLLRAILQDPAGAVEELPLIAAEERQKILIDWNRTDKSDPVKTVSELFSEQARRTPSAVAIEWEGRKTTYQALEAEAGKLAAGLRARGIGPGALVAVCLGRSPALISAILGILKAGAAYVPLDPTHPAERLGRILEDAKAPLLITERKLLPSLEGPAKSGPTAILLCPEENPAAGFRAGEGAGPGGTAASAGPDDLAYVIFTSGSTGRPKGVAVTHRGVSGLVAWGRQTYGEADLAGVLASTSVCFDLSVFEFFVPLCSGGRIILVEDALSLPGLSARSEVRLINTVPSAAAELIRLRAIPASVRTINLAGEFLPQELVERIHRETKVERVFDLYGPTEDTVYSTFALRRPGGTPSIGRPLPNKQAYILDQRLRPVPVGVPGELCLSGEGLARGYWRQPELTAEKFIAHPFRAGRRLYRTGDLARFRPDGEIEYLGRIDHQVKLRGYRIELGEVESALRRLPGVRECVAVVREDKTGEKRLVAFAAADPERRVELREWRRSLGSSLPAYMLPASLVLLDRLPHTPNGKIDRKALPDRAEEEVRRITPRDELESRLARIWESVLGSPPGGVHDIFFEQGGHSLLAVRLISEIESGLGKRLPISAIYQAPTIRGLATLIRGGEEEEGGAELVEIQGKGSRPPLFLVHGMAGGMLWGYSNLSRHLGPDQPVYAFKSRGLEGKEEFATIEEMAEHYCRALLRFQPEGPYCLGGYCFGGNVAFEVARRLEASGHEVGLLALFNSSPPNSEFTRPRWTPARMIKFLYNLCLWAKDFGKWNPRDRRQFFHWKLRTYRLRLARGRSRPAAQPSEIDPDKLVDLRAFPDDQQAVLAAHIRALASLHHGRYRGRVTLFRSRGYPLQCSFDPHFGWNEFAGGGVDLVHLPGKHDSILEEPYVRTLAREIDLCLGRVAAGKEAGR